MNCIFCENEHTLKYNEELFLCTNCLLVFKQSNFSFVQRTQQFNTDNLENNYELYREKINERLQKIAPYMQKQDNDIKYLNIGCGLGHSLVRMKELNYAYLGIDISNSVIDACKQRELNIRTGIVEQLIGTYDIIECINTFEYIDNINTFLESIYDLLDEDGLFVLQTKIYNISNVLKDESRYFYPSSRSLELLLTFMNFKIVESIKTDNDDKSVLIIMRKNSEEQINEL